MRVGVGLGWKAAALLAATGLLWWLIADREYRQESGLNDIKVVVASPREIHQPGDPIPIRLIATNTGKSTFVYDTAVDGHLLEPHRPEGLGPPRSAYDLLFVGHTEDRKGQREKFTWVWSEHANVSPTITRVELKPGESRELVRFTWQPPPAEFVQGRFIARFASVEFSTGIGFEVPRR